MVKTVTDENTAVMHNGIPGRYTADWWPALVRCPRCHRDDSAMTRPWRGFNGRPRAWIYTCTCRQEWWIDGGDAS